jgi:hypothetical protein
VRDRARPRFAWLVVGATALSGCGPAPEPPELVEFRKLAETMRTGAASALAVAQPIVDGDANAVLEEWRDEVERHAKAEQAVHSMLLQGRELLRRGALDVVARHADGRQVLDAFLAEYERLADGYEGLRVPYADLLEGLDPEAREAAGLGRGPAAANAEVTARVEQMAKRSDQVLARYLEDRAHQARTLRLAGAKLEGYEAARKGQAFMERRGLGAEGAFAAVAADLEKLVAVE